VPEIIRRAGRRAAALRGAGQVLDLRAQRRRRLVLPTAEEALAGDWRAVGGDLRTALRRYSGER
jgi:hypothetical protein